MIFFRCSDSVFYPMMVKKKVHGAESKSLQASKLKTKKTSSQTLRQKSQPLKPTAQSHRKPQSLGAKGRPPRSETGVSESPSQDVKDIPKTKRLKPVQVQENRVDAEDLLKGDDVVSQMQLCERSAKERLAGIEIPTAGNEERLSMSSPPPNLLRNLNPPEVSTPFNKRLVSSTPDPERLLEIEKEVAISSQALSHNCPPQSSPQMIPERDTANEEKAKLTLSGIGEFLKEQKKNQLIWQQQLEQIQKTHLSDKPEGQRSSAFYQWLGLPSSSRSNVESIPISGPQNDINASYNFRLPKAEWVEETDTPRQSPINSCQNQSLGAEKQPPNMVRESPKSDEKSVPYAMYGHSSGNQEKGENIPWHGRDETTNVSGQNQEVTTGKKPTGESMKLHTLPHTTTKESNFYDRFASSKPLSSVKPGLGFKTSAPQEIFKLKSETSSVLYKREFVTKTLKPKSRPKNSVIVNTAKDSKGKKKQEKDLVVDERGVDIPPSGTEAEKCPQANVEFDSVKMSDMDIVNVSMSTCSGEVNSLLSSDANERRHAHLPKPIPKNADCVNIPVETFDGPVSQRELSSSDKLALLDLISDVDHPDTSDPIDSVVMNSDCSPQMKEEAIEERDTKDKEMEQLTSKTTKASLEQGLSSVPFAPLASSNVETIETENTHNVEIEIKDSNDVKGANVNQNYHNEDRHHHKSHHLDLQYLDKMADPTLRNIACRLALKSTAIRDGELRSLIDSMIFHSNAALAHQDSQLHSSQIFFTDENNKLKKRIHTVNKQLEAKERLERQADNYMGVSNTDMMHLERKNLYLRQEKDRLDQQVTKLLEEKATWLITQQDLVKTISLKDHEILKLEEKQQEEKKALHQALDQATKNSQGVHFKLSVADREISNLEQRMKAKERDICDLKDQLKDIERELTTSTDSSKKKDEEMVRLQDLVDTLKIGVEEVLKAYESSGHGRDASEDQRRGIKSLHQMVHGSSRHDNSSDFLPRHSHWKEKQRSRGDDLHQQHHSHRVRDRELPSRHADHLLDSSLLPVEKRREERQHGTVSDGSSLTLQAVEEHNRRYSPVDRSLWRSLETEPVMPVIEADEPYHSDSEVHIMNARGRRRRRREDMESYPYGRSSSLSPERHNDRERSRRDSFLHRTEKRSRIQPDTDFHMGESRRQGRLKKSWYPSDEVLTSTRKLCNAGTDARPGAGHLSFEDSDLVSLPLRTDTSLNEQENPRYTVTDYYKQYSDRVKADRAERAHAYSMNSLHHLRGVEEPNVWINKPFEKSMSQKYNRWRAHHDSEGTQDTSLKSLSLPERYPSDNDRFQTQTTRNSSNDPHFQMYSRSIGMQEPSTTSNLLSLSYPGPSSSRNRGPLPSSTEPTASLMSASLPISPSRARDENLDHRHFPDYHHRSSRVTSQSESKNYPLHSDRHRNLQLQDYQTGRQMMADSGRDPPQHSQTGKRTVTFHERNIESPRTPPPQSFQSDFLDYQTSFPPQSSPVNTSDISVSRRATRDSHSFQQDFFQGTELSASLSSISDQDIRRDVNNSNNNKALDEDSFSTGIASLDEKIAKLQEKINHTKAVFS